MDLSSEERKILLECARESIYSLFGKPFLLKPEYDKHPVLKTPAGAFVTLRKHDQLRGCVGFIEAESFLFDTVTQAARYAAFHDSRFLKVEIEEMDDISIEISVLSPAEKMSSYDDIEIGKHGLILEENSKRALLLPQVPIEHNLNRDQFLSALCEKAGLYKEYWQTRVLNILLFTATIFSEEKRR